MDLRQVCNWMGNIQDMKGQKVHILQIQIIINTGQNYVGSSCIRAKILPITFLSKHRMCVLSCVQHFVTPWSLQPARLLCPQDFQGKNTGVGCHFLLQGIFLTLRLKPVSLTSPAMAGGFLTTTPPGKPKIQNNCIKKINFIMVFTVLNRAYINVFLLGKGTTYINPRII